MTLPGRLRGKGDLVYLTALIFVVMGICLFWGQHSADQARQSSERAGQQAIKVAVAQSNRQWCAVVGKINEADRQGGRQPTTAFGKALNAALEQRYVSLGCKNPDPPPKR
jgi:hypothetical protein